MRKLLAAVAISALWVAPALADNVFRWAPQGNVATLDPDASGDTTTRNILINVYEGLVRQDKKMQLEPELAVSWEAIAPTTWRIKLRPNVTFHDGSPFTADDVVYSFKRATASSSDIRAKLRAVKEMVKVDDLTVDAMTNGPAPILMKGVLYFMPVMSKVWAEKNDAVDPADNRRTGKENFATRNANGTGPFKIVAYSSADGKIELVPNDKWWDKKEHNLSKVMITPIAANGTRVAALLSGEVELITPIPMQDVDRVKATAGLEILSGPEARVVYLGYDQWRDELLYSNIKGRNPFKDIRVRQAFARAIDMEAIRDKVLRGAGLPLFAMVPDNADGWDKDFWNRPKPDLAIARKLMADAGYPDGFSVTMDCPSDGLSNMGEPVCVAITGMLARIGVKVDVLLQPTVAYAGKLGRRDTSFYVHSWGAATGDALATIDLTVYSYGDGTGTWNVGSYSNPEVDKLINGAASEMDMAIRRGMLTKALSIHREQLGTIPLYQPMLNYAASKKVEVVQRGDDGVQLRWVKFR
jgi:peptide/nickel transport system substrate-binding protein